MKLLLLFGDSAVGKMTVGQELMKLTGLRLLHNHMTIDPVLELFGTFHTRTIVRLREVMLEEFAKTDNYGIIFTFMWDFDDPADYELTQHLCDIFKQASPDTDIYYVELTAPLEIRLERNITENRLLHKPSKRNLADSRQRVLNDYQKHRCTSRDGELDFENYIKIDNSNLSPEEAARIIQKRFDL